MTVLLSGSICTGGAPQPSHIDFAEFADSAPFWTWCLDPGDRGSGFGIDPHSETAISGSPNAFEGGGDVVKGWRKSGTSRHHFVRLWVDAGDSPFAGRPNAVTRRRNLLGAQTWVDCDPRDIAVPRVDPNDRVCALTGRPNRVKRDDEILRKGHVEGLHRLQRHRRRGDQ